ncbi:hypothetical protein [Sphingobacterium mizutaii]|uniref:hypothetical protein n=1 Tax=Sphingobacterium mizutaii TaxID=1010 RepID=UPI0016234D90|nr:hypothetical protein [Sphingobacterium mizutaii]
MKILKTLLLFSGLLLGLYSSGQNVTYNNVRIGLDAPAIGVNILTNWPNLTTGWIRGFSISNHNDSEKFVYFGSTGNAVNGISTLYYNFIGKTHTNPYMVFLPNGNVGIGTVSPNVKLAINGNIRAREVKVDASGWPDYVFKKDHHLPSLKETEEFIKQNGHLPGVPSALDAESNGISLGEMNKILLKKIEEITLYLIDKDKEIDSLRKEIDSLNSN